VLTKSIHAESKTPHAATGKLTLFDGLQRAPGDTKADCLVKLENVYSRVDLQTHSGSAANLFDGRISASSTRMQAVTLAVGSQDVRRALSLSSKGAVSS